jgi:hypothetical protein
MTEMHVVFGTERLAMLYSQRMAVNPNKVVLATRPELVASFRGGIIAVRYPDDVWQPPTDPSKRYVQETNDILKKLEKDGFPVRTVQM